MLDRVESQIRANEKLVSDSVPEPDLDEPATKKKASAMSHGIGSLKVENAAAHVSVLLSTEVPRPSRATAPRETGSGRQRYRVGFERRGLGVEGEIDDEMREKVE